MRPRRHPIRPDLGRRPSRLPRTLAVGAAVCLALAASACGEDEAGPIPQTGEVETTTTTEATTTTAAPTTAPGEQGEGAGAGAPTTAPGEQGEGDEGAGAGESTTTPAGGEEPSG